MTIHNTKHLEDTLQVAIITTIDHNVGDDFVRAGINYLLTQSLQPFRTLLVHKHTPITVRKEFEWYHSLGIDALLDAIRPGTGKVGSRLLDRIPGPVFTDKIKSCDILVQSGAPIYWLNHFNACHDNEWYVPLIKQRWLRAFKRVPFLNIGGGTCQAFYSDASEFTASKPTLDYISELFDIAALTTVRDDLSLKVLALAGKTAPKLPCPSLFAATMNKVGARSGEYVVLNYMSNAGHYDYNDVDYTKQWQREFAMFARSLIEKERCIVACHNRSEWEQAARLLPDVPRFHSRSYIDYLDFYSRAKYGIVNRVHGAFAMASLGKPSIIVGSDSRSCMGKEIGLPVVFVGEATSERLSGMLPTVRALASDYPDMIADLKNKALLHYKSLIDTAINDAHLKR